jgi:NAD(P)-dependent dehydrogenase (short-subunit alcohol dehydrogenase family)
MDKSLKGKVAVVTGAGSVPGPPDQDMVGNGKACAMVYAREGASVLVVDLNIEAVRDTKQRIDAEGGG